VNLRFTVPGQTISAVIPVHNRADLLARLLETIRAQSVSFAEVVVVDNLSSDSAVAIARNFGCKVIEMSENAGFARAVNRGWRSASGPWIAILNSDVELDSRWAESLLASAGHADFAVGTILNATDRTAIDGTYDLVSRGACAWRAGNGENAAQLPEKMKPIAIAPGTACLFRRDALQRLHGFDEQFGSYLEDVDLGLRCIREGLTGVFVPEALAWHHGSATLGPWNPAVVRLISRNQLLLVSRHYDRALFLSCLWPIVVGQLLWGLVALRHGTLLAWLSGKWEALREFHLDGAPSPGLREFLAASEREISARSRDSYWRWYFRLIAGAAH
jgi:GT2 family glycosyltransferase